MNDMTAKENTALFAQKSERLLGFLQTASLRLRSGSDAEGMESLLSAVDELEQAVEMGPALQASFIEWEQLLPAVRKLDMYLDYHDITGIIDLIEDTLCPMAEGWVKGSDGI